MAVPESLQKLVEDGVIDEIQQRLMSGKEASVYVVSHRGVIVAAKVYKARDRRTFKSTSSYTEGRNQTRNTRDKRAMERRSAYGKEQMEDSWRDMEYRALFDAHHAGVRVPKPIMLYEEVLLMDLLVDAHDAPAPRLADVDLTADEAGAMLKEVYRQVRLLLGAGRIHGDLSAFNILMAAGGPTLIDLPQVVDAAGNNQAREILKRDLRNVVEHLSRFDERLLRFIDCGEALYQHYQRGTLDEATEPREVRREHGGGRRTRGQERPEGFVAQPRRGPPQQGRGPQQFDRGPQQGRGPQHPQQGRGGYAGNGPERFGPPRNGAPDNRGPQRDARGQDGPPWNGPPRNGPPRNGPPWNGPPRNGPPDNRGPQRGPDHRGEQQRGTDRGGPQQQQQRGPDRGPQQQQQRGTERGGPQQQQQRGPDRGGPQQQQQRGPDRGGAHQQQQGPARWGSNHPRDPRDRPPVEVDVIRRRTKG